MKRDYKVYLDDILDSIEKIIDYTEGRTKSDFTKDNQLQDAVLRRFEIIGEAVKHIPDDIKEKHPEIEWEKAAGARNIFVHEYFGVRLERVWKTIINDLPLFEKQIKSLVEE